MNFKGKKIAVIGAGVEGLSSAAWLKKHGAKVTVLDKKQGEHYLDNLDQYDMIVRSPGVKLTLPEIEAARKAGVTITSQTKLFFDLAPCKIIGVTGTKGKGTTASLIYEMLRKDGKSLPAGRQGAYLGGNIGEPPFNFLDKINPQDWVVLELSSFQLQDLGKSPADAKAMAGKPHIAVMLMVTSEHLDYHKDTLEYVEAKRNILRNQSASDFAVINRDYPATNESDVHTNAKVYYVSREREVERGCFVKDGKIMLRLGSLPHVASDARRAQYSGSSGASSSLSERRSPQRSAGSNYNSGSAFNSLASGQSSREGIVAREVIATKDILLPGKHNWENVCAAVVAASLAGVRMSNIVHVLKTFKGLEHRLELVRTVGGVRFYDDSFSTTPETAIAAIEAFEQPEILILGGSSKGSDFSQLGKVIAEAKNIKAIIGIGMEWERIKKSVSDAYTSSVAMSNVAKSRSSSRQARTIPILMIEGAKDMKTIVQACVKLAEPGDVVLLSPACASFGMFKNYKDRGSQFKQEVEKL